VVIAVKAVADIVLTVMIKTQIELIKSEGYIYYDF